AIFVINAPFMQDAEGHSSDGITLSIAEIKNGQFTLKMTLDEEWLNSEGVVYPVTVDPIMTASRVLFSENGCYSSYVSAEMPNASFGKKSSSEQGTNYEGSLYIGYENNRGAVRSYFKCENLPTLSVGDKIVDATLSMYLVDSNTLTVNVFKVLSGWETHTVTWNNQPSVDNYLVSDYHNFKGETNSWISWEITDLARLWYSGELANNGIMFKADYEGNSHRRARFYSTGYTTYSEARPLLVISYRNMSGYEDYYSYTNLSSGNGGVASVNNYNGNFVYSQYLTEDCGGEIMPVNVSLVYNSNKAHQSYANLGNGVQTNYNLFIKPNPNIKTDSIEEEKKYKYYLNDADGTEHYFYFEDLNGETGKDEDGLGYELWVNPENNTPADENERFHWVKYRITDKDKNIMEFNRYGLLIRIKSSIGKEITVQHEDSVNSEMPRIKYIYDGVGRVYTFNYTGDNRISEIIDPAGRATKLSYVNAFLYEITFPDGERVSYGHNGGQWTYIQSESGNTEITYDNSGQKRVSLIKTVFDGTVAESYSFKYLQNETVVTDLANRDYTYQFNDYGQTTGIVSDNSGQAQFFSFAPGNSTSANANKLNTSSKIQTSTVNYLKNPSFSSNLENYWVYNTAPDNTYSVTAETGVGHFGNGCVKINKTNATGLTSAVQEIGVVPSGVYTLSAYAMTGSEAFNGKGFLILEIYNGDTRETGYVVDVYQSNTWDKYSLTASVGEGKTLRVLVGVNENSTGTMWFDDIQLESGYGANSFNLLENSGFKNGSDCWSVLGGSSDISNHIAQSGVSTLGAAEVPGQTNAIYTRAISASKNNFLSQRVNVNGKKGDVFSIGGWAYATSAPLNNGTKPENEIPQFDILFEFYDSNGQLVGSEKKDFNPDVDAWQFASFMAIAPKDYAYCLYFVEYNRNINNLYFTGGYCYKETYGQTYTYDDNGNIVSTQDLAKTESSFAYSNNQMSKLLNPSGSRYMYSYDDQNKLIYALSSDGQQYGFEYDGNGNVKNTFITPLKPATVIENGKTYYIVNAGTGKAIDSGEASSGADEVTCQSYLAYLDSQKWYVLSGEGNNTFELGSIQRSVGTPSRDNAATYYFKVSGESNTNGNVVMTNNEYYNTDNQYFKPVKNDDGTFTLYMKKSGYDAGVNGEYKCLNCAETEAVNNTPKNTVYETTCDPYNLKETIKWYFYEVPSDNEKYLSTHAYYTDNGNFTTGINDVNGNNVSYNYSETSGQLLSTTDGLNNKTQYEYAPNSNRITSVTALNNQNGQVAKSNYIYDASNRLSSIQSSSGQLYSFTYDSFGRVTSIKIGSQELISTTYDQFSRPTVKSYGNGQYITTVYDNLDRVKEIRYNDDSSKKITYGYANNGNLAIVTDYFSGRKTVYTYDLSGRVVDVKTYSTTDLNNYSTLCDWFKYGYADKTNYLVSVTHWTPETDTQQYEYVYGDVNQGQMPDQIYSVKFNGQVIRNYTFDDFGRLQKKSTPLSSGSEVEHNYSYGDLSGTRTSTQVSSFENKLGTYSYSYDYNGNITAIAFASWDEDVAPSKTTYYTYDALGQLVDVVEGVDHYAYGYDSSGNITFNGYIYNNDESTFVEKTYTYGDNEWRDQLTSFNGQDFGYDALGNPTLYKGANLTWSEGRRLASFDNGAYSLTFAYDSSGKRIQKTVNGMEYNYVYSGDTVIAITYDDGSPVLKFICDENGDYVGFTYGTGTYYYVRNLQNDVVAIVDANQNVLATYSYDPWGNCTVSGKFANTIGDINPIRYRGYFYDEETGLYYLQSRYYDPDTCRFINADE
ncbi:MAG: RHS repeat-associated core domain-containing protein, partial [Clostridia bacterium]|nr:RHS repeat-associated core domain-containing protein [Clostridia bacterium]